MRIHYQVSQSETIDLGEGLRKSGIYDFKTGEEILIGDYVCIGIIEYSENNLNFEKLTIQGDLPIIAEEDGKPYVFGHLGRPIYSSDKFTNNIRQNMITALSEMRDGSDYLYVVWKDINENVVYDLPDGVVITQE